jgi:hypothetical protein
MMIAVPRASLLALASALAALACSPEYQLLETLEVSQTAGQGVGASGVGASGVGASGGAGPSGGVSPSGGASDETGGHEAGGTTGVGGSAGEAIGGEASAGAPVGGSGGALAGACTTHGDCAPGSRCSGYRCVDCAELSGQCAITCEHGFELVTLERNGCSSCECAPRSACSSNADCDGGETCYAGAQCAEGCADPSCCFGNRCGPTGCGPLPDVCLAFGCANGDECLAACDRTSCDCDGVSWICQSTTGGAPVASCPQACAPP